MLLQGVSFAWCFFVCLLFGVFFNLGFHNMTCFHKRDKIEDTDVQWYNSTSVFKCQFTTF